MIRLCQKYLIRSVFILQQFSLYLNGYKKFYVGIGDYELDEYCGCISSMCCSQGLQGYKVYGGAKNDEDYPIQLYVAMQHMKFNIANATMYHKCMESPCLL